LQEKLTQYEGSLPYSRKDEPNWNRLVSRVEQISKGDPLHRLQTVGRVKGDFLYDIATSGRMVHLKPGIPYCFRKFYTLIGDFVRGAWVRYIRKYNADVFGSSNDLHEFLFGSERCSVGAVKPILREAQQGDCLYCHRPLIAKVIAKGEHVDHFIPWSRYPVNLGHNFVLAHAKCNSDKSDFLAGRDHVLRWLQLVQTDSSLGKKFEVAGVVQDLQRSMRIAEWAYNQTHTVRGMSWIRGNQLEALLLDWSGLIQGAQAQP
jgi:hypothetical protein